LGYWNVAVIANPLAGRATRDRDIGYDHRRAAGVYIAELRIRRGFSQRELAKVLGVVNTAISAIELGRNSVPPERYEELADALGVPHRTFAKVMLKHTNPWLFAMLYPDEMAPEELNTIPERIMDDRVA